MAKGKIQGITIEFAADSTALTKALKEADTASKKTQKSLREIDKALKFDPHNVTLLKQKQTELGKAIDATTKELEIFKKEQEAMDNDPSVDKTSEEYLKLQRNIIQCENSLKDYESELKSVSARTSSIGAMGEQFQAVGEKCTALGQKLAGVSAAAAGVVASIGAVTYSTGVWADDLNTLSKVTGISTEKLQMYSAAADLVDVSTETIAKSVTKMKKNMMSASEGTGDAADAFKTLGVAVTDADGNLRNQDEVFSETLKALGEMSNETERDALAMQIFGKSATELNPLIEDCGETYKMVADEFASGGLELLDQETIDKANEFNDSVDMMKMKLEQAKNILGAGLADAFGDDMEKLSELVGKVAEKIAGMNPETLKVITIIAAVVAALSPVLLVVGGLISSIGSIMGVLAKLGPILTTLGGVIKTVFTTLAANPIGLVIIAIMSAILIIKKLYDNCEGFRKFCDKLIAKFKELGESIKDFAKNAINKIKEAVESIKQKFTDLKISIIKKVMQIKSGIKNAFKNIADIGKNIVTGLWNGITNKFQWLVGKIKSFANNVKDKLKSFFGIHSPSKWAKDVIGGNIAKGIGVGFTSSMASVTDDMKNTITKSKNALAVKPTSAVDRMSASLSTLASSGSTGNSASYSFGNITIDVSSLDDIATVEDFALMMKRAKAFA